MFFGCRIQTYEHENDWGKALTTYDLDMDEGQTSTKIGLLQVCVLVIIPWYHIQKNVMWHLVMNIDYEKL